MSSRGFGPDDKRAVRAFLNYESGGDPVPWRVERAVNFRPFPGKDERGVLADAESVVEAQAYSDTVVIMVADEKATAAITICSRAACQAIVRVLQAALYQGTYPWVGDDDYGARPREAP